MLGYHRQARILGATRRHVNEIVVVVARSAHSRTVSLIPADRPCNSCQTVSLIPMKILVVGGGAREHALAWKLSRERGVTEVLCAPGNPASPPSPAACPPTSRKPAELLAIAEREAVDLTVVGPELPLEPRRRRPVRRRTAARSSVRRRPRRRSSRARRSRRTSWRGTACRPRASASAIPPTRRSRRSRAASSAIRW